LMPDLNKLWPDKPGISDLDGTAATPRHDCKVLELDQVTPEPIKWLWPGRIPLCMFSLLAGNPGVGKSTIAFSIAAIVSTGGTWPFSGDRATAGTVVIMSAEDDPKYTVVPRLMAAGADLTRVKMIQSVARLMEDGERVIDAPLLLAEDMGQLHGVLDQYPDTRLLILDPLSAYLGVRDSHRDSDVRQVLGPLTDLAAKHEVSILGNTHLNKAAGHSAIARFMGSTGIIAAARAAFLATKHEEELMLLPVKSNVAPGDIGGLIYQIKGATIAGDIETSCIEWTGQTDIDPNDVLSQQQARTRSPKLIDAMDFLEDQLSNGPKRQVEIEKAATPAGHTEGTLKRARKELNITSHKDQFSGGWKWYTQEQFTMKTEQEKRR
jgi:putative DNA primase/helicase